MMTAETFALFRSILVSRSLDADDPAVEMAYRSALSMLDYAVCDNLEALRQFQVDED